MKEYLIKELESSIKTKKDFFENNMDLTIHVAKKFVETIKNGKKIVFFGNGGSAADSQHLAAELVNKLRIKRKGLNSIALTTDTSIITSIANDISFDDIFSRQIEALCQEGDLAIAISTSGNSKNVIKAILKAKDMGLYVVSFTGGDGGIIKKENISDANLNVEKSSISSRIQETHIFLGHIIIELMDEILKS
jgi:D-sedoheptulose 7-phosphate isomerase